MLGVPRSYFRAAGRTVLLVSKFLVVPAAMLTIQPHLARAANSTVPGTLSLAATQQCVGITWFITGDDDQDCRVTVSFRKLGTNDPYKNVQSLLRVEPGSYNGNGIDPGNLLAGSIFGLLPATDYSVRLVLTDPDGGTSTQTQTVRTRGWPTNAPNPRHRYVVPGTGGGSGTSTDPFRGIAAADAAAAPGDLFHLRPGVYLGGANFTRSGTAEQPIVWRGDSRSTVILDGLLTVRDVINLVNVSHLRIETLTVQNPNASCVRGSNTSDISVRDCNMLYLVDTARDMFGIDFRGPSNTDAYISENRVQGPITWIAGRNVDHYGVLVQGTGHVIRYNEIHGLYDGVQVGSDEGLIVTSNCDIYGNEIYDCTDDGVEFDGSRHNIRCFDNRITNVLCGFSAQPVYGGPVYMIRNVIYNWQLKALKFHLNATGMIVMQNTFVGADPRGWGGGDWRNTITRNNLFLGGSHPSGSDLPIPIYTNGIKADLDYDGWYQVYPDKFARFNNVSYPYITNFSTSTGQEHHGKLVTYSIFADADEPPLGPHEGEGGYLPGYAPGSQDVRLRAGAAAIDVGVLLANVNDGFLGPAPDLGAYEYGAPLPIYGPGAGVPADVLTEFVMTPAVEIVAFPNPFREETELSLAGAESWSGAVEIVDISGRRVRQFELSSAQGRVSWDGRTDDGELLPAGVYFVRPAHGRSGARLIKLH